MEFLSFTYAHIQALTTGQIIVLSAVAFVFVIAVIAVLRQRSK